MAASSLLSPPPRAVLISVAVLAVLQPVGASAGVTLRGLRAVKGSYASDYASDYPYVWSGWGGSCTEACAKRGLACDPEPMNAVRSWDAWRDVNANMVEAGEDTPDIGESNVYTNYAHYPGIVWDPTQQKHSMLYNSGTDDGKTTCDARGGGTQDPRWVSRLCSCKSWCAEGQFALTNSQLSVQGADDVTFSLNPKTRVVTVKFPSAVRISEGPTYGYVRVAIPSTPYLRPDMSNTAFSTYDPAAPYKPGFKCAWSGGQVWFKHEFNYGSNMWSVDKTEQVIPAGTECTYPAEAAALTC